jgi:hypothetical protein
VLARGPAARLIGCAVARHALLIGVSEFTDQRLARLNAPTNDVIALSGILQDSSRGSFDSVELSVNEDFLAVRDHLSRFFHDRAPMICCCSIIRATASGPRQSPVPGNRRIQSRYTT